MIAPDRVVVRDGAAVLDHGVKRRALDREPLRAELARLAQGMEREVGRGAVRIDMSEAAGHFTLATGRLFDRILRCVLDRVVEFFEALPGDCRLERVVDD